jgi:L-lactate dehydrogenase complex protein LldE
MQSRATVSRRHANSSEYSLRDTRVRTTHTPSRSEQARCRVKVGLFITCLADTIFPDVGRATVAVLERLGHEVVFPAEQTCCGQMHLNSGYPARAAQLAVRFEELFGDFEAVVAPSSSCVGTLRQVFGVANIFELSELLVHRFRVEDVGASFTGSVCYHPTCHSLRTTAVGDAPLRLLAHVQGLELRPLERAEECCGFGGTFSVKNPAVSTAMCDDKCAAIERSEAMVCTAVDGSCLMQIGGRLARRGSRQRTLHLAEILAGET